MMHMVLFILDDPDKLDEVLDAWDKIGVSGVTIAETNSLYRRRHTQLGARYLFGVSRGQEGHYALYTIVPDEATIQRCLEAVESIVGDLSQPNNGILTAWPLPFVKGVPSELLDPGEER